nr:hypothetical protein [Tanacetum cinerariifolium]
MRNRIIGYESANEDPFQGTHKYDWSDQAEEGPNYVLMAYTSSSYDSNLSNDSTCLNYCLETVKFLKSQNEKLLKDLEKYELMVLGYENYNAVPPPYIGNFMPSKPDLSFTRLDEFVNNTVVENYEAKSSENEPKVIRKHNDALVIEEWVSDNEEEEMT